jgi:hypothetical protein
MRRCKKQIEIDEERKGSLNLLVPYKSSPAAGRTVELWREIGTAWRHLWRGSVRGNDKGEWGNR